LVIRAVGAHTVTVVVGVEKAAFLMPVQRVVGGIQIENDLIWDASVRLEEQRDCKPLNRFLVTGPIVQPIESLKAGANMA
jgi:hypothetical protein